jgi:hypothetical protein
MLKADSLLAEGFLKLMEFLQVELQLGIGMDDSLIKEIEWAINVRNIIIHNRGRTNERFIKRVGDEHEAVDVPLVIEPNQVNYWLSHVLNGICFIDKAFVEKYGMEPFVQFAPFPTLAEGVEWGGIRISSIDITSSEQLNQPDY